MELQRWKRFLDGLPDLRSRKLVVSRESQVAWETQETQAALAGNRYDYEAILNETADRIFREINHEPPAPRRAS